MAQGPAPLYTLSQADLNAVADIEATIDAAMSSWNPEQATHTFGLADGTNARVARKLRANYTAAGWAASISEANGVYTLTLKDPSHAANVATLP